MDWIVNIWTKPLASWTLLDAIKGCACYAVAHFLYHLAKVAWESREPRISIDQRHAAARKAMGYDRE